MGLCDPQNPVGWCFLPTPTCNFFKNQMWKGRNTYTQAENTYGCDLQKCLLGFPIFGNQLQNLQNHFNTEINLKNPIWIFFLLNSVFFFYGSRNVCKQENIFCMCMEIKIQKNIIIFNYLTSAGLSMQLGNPLTCPWSASSKIPLEAAVSNL